MRHLLLDECEFLCHRWRQSPVGEPGYPHEVQDQKDFAFEQGPKAHTLQHRERWILSNGHPCEGQSTEPTRLSALC